MVSSSRKDRICVMFDSFSKAVSHSFVINLDQAESNWDKHFVTYN